MNSIPFKIKKRKHIYLQLEGFPQTTGSSGRKKEQEKTERESSSSNGKSVHFGPTRGDPSGANPAEKPCQAKGILVPRRPELDLLVLLATHPPRRGPVSRFFFADCGARRTRDGVCFAWGSGKTNLGDPQKRNTYRKGARILDRKANGKPKIHWGTLAEIVEAGKLGLKGN